VAQTGPHIKPSHRGLFTAKAHRAGESVQEYAQKKAHAGGVLGKEANFARMAKRGWKPLKKHSTRAHMLAKKIL
jgi:hypothetical protein